jgi:3-hydroxyacyl-[acyl-carrier-protein] dehydratase
MKILSWNCRNSRTNFLPSSTGTHKNARYSIIFALNENMTEINQTADPPPAEASKTVPSKTTMEIGDILKILPHRYPFLLIDRVVELVRMKSIVALKNVTITEPFFQGHFPDKPIMPGVLIVEAIAQAGGLLLLTEIPNRDELLMVFTGIEKARFRRPVVPGDQLRIEVVVKAWRMTAARLEGKAYVDGKVAAEATVTCRLVPRGLTKRSAESEGGL